MNNVVITSPLRYHYHPPATSGANRRSKFVAHSHALTHTASASRVCAGSCVGTTSARPEKHLYNTLYTPLTERTLYPSKQPIVSVSTAQTTIESIVNSRISKQAPKIAADFAGSQAKDLKTQASQEADPTKRQALLGESAKWEEGGIYRVAMHTVIGGLAGGASGALGAGSSASAAPLIDQLQSGLQAKLEAAGVPPSLAKASAAMVGNATAAGIGAATGGSSGAAMAFNVDADNRQLHPSETKRIKKLADKKAKETCRGSADCERSANLYWTDMLQSAAEGRVDNDKAKQNHAYYNQVVNAAGIPGSEAAVTGASTAYFNNLKVAQDMLQADTGKPILMANGQVQLGSDGKPQTYFSATDAQRADSTLNIFPGGLPSSVSSVIPGKDQRDKDRLERLTAANGSATPDTTMEELVIGLRVPARTGASLIGTTSATQGATLSAEQALLRSGGMLDRTGAPLLDMKGLTTAQKQRVGDLFGADTVKQIVPEGSKIARTQGSGTQGIDDLYRVNRPDVDYVNIEYKFVGQDGKTGAQVLSTTNNGRQGSIGWISGSNRIENAVGDQAAPAVYKAIDSGRFESWVVTTRPDGSTFVEVLDAAGRPKPTDASRLILPARNLSGAQR